MKAINNLEAKNRGGSHSKMEEKNFMEDLSDTEIKRLLLRIIRKNPNWISSICKDPRIVGKEIGYKNAFKVYNFFKNEKVIDFIVENFKKPSIGAFSHLLENCHIFFDNEFVISEEIKEFNASIKNIEREYNKLPRNNHSYEDNKNNSFYLSYGIHLKEPLIVLNFYVLIYIFCAKGHFNIYQINKKELSYNIENKIGYRSFCPDCMERFIFPPNLARFVEDSNRRAFQVNSYLQLRTIEKIPKSFTNQLISYIEPELLEEPKEVLGEKIDELITIPPYIENISNILERSSKTLTKEFRLYKNKIVYFYGINLNNLKFNNLSGIDETTPKSIVKRAIDDFIESNISNSYCTKIINRISELYQGNYEKQIFNLMVYNYFTKKGYFAYADKYYRKATHLKS